MTSSTKKRLKRFGWGTFIAFAVGFFPFWGVELGMLIQGVFTGEYCDKPTPCGYWGLLQWFYPFWLLAGVGIWSMVILLLVIDLITSWYKSR